MNRRNPDHVIKQGEQLSGMDFVLSSSKPDRVGDVIEQKGWELSNFKKTGSIALFGHESSFPIGTWKNVRVQGNKLIGTLKMAAAGTSARIDEIRSLIEQGILKSTSVGFRVKDYEPIDETDPWGAWRIMKAELTEVSIVSVPANPDAVALAKELGVSRATRDLIFASRKASDEPGASRKASDTHLIDVSVPSDIVRAQRAYRSQHPNSEY